jgi:hypothetical protein
MFPFIWILVYFINKKKSKTALWIGLWPLITDSFIYIIILSILLKVQTRYDLFQLFGTANPLSVLLYFCGISFAVASFWSAYHIMMNRRERMPGFFFFYSPLASIFNIVFTLYFLSNGLGIPTWM